MNRCHSCGRALAEKQAYARVKVGGETYLFCCPMCQSAFNAGALQRRMILQAFSDDRASILVEYLPALQVGGDYTCIRAVGDDKLYVIVADISGHGIGSSLVMSRIGAEIERLVQTGEDIVTMAEVLNNLMTSSIGEDMYLTLFGSEIEFPARTISYVNCGHPAQLLWSQKHQKYTRLESQHLPVGVFGPEMFKRPQRTSVEINTGDKLMLFTDGLLELKLEDGSELGELGLIKMFRSLLRNPTEEMKRQIFEQIKASQTDHLDDDLLFILVDIKSAGSSRIEETLL